MAVTVRLATSDDVPGIVRIWEEIVAEGVHTAASRALTVAQQWSYMNTLEDREAVFVAEDGGTIVGFQTLDLFAKYTGSMAHVGAVRTYVSTKFRRCGVGKRLMENAFRFAYQKGYEKLIARVEAQNRGGRTFYESLGFVEVGKLHRQVRFGNQYDDEVIMERFLAIASSSGIGRSEAWPEESVSPLQVSQRPWTLPEVEEVAVRRARESDLPVLARILSRVTGKSLQVVEGELREQFGQRAHWIATTQSGIGIVSWFASRLVACVRGFLVYPQSELEPIGNALLGAVEEDAMGLQCAAILLFAKRDEPVANLLFYQSKGYVSEDLEKLQGGWRDVAEKSRAEDEFVLFKRLFGR